MIDPIARLFDSLWQDYIHITPSALSIQQLFQRDQSAEVMNDHIALRTFKHEKVGLHKLARHFTQLGYEAKGDYHFAKKHLDANHFEHDNKDAPKVFISELDMSKLSEDAQHILLSCIEKIDENAHLANNFLWSGRHWPINLNDYQVLLAESEYAAWMYVWGFRANHFTVSINHLENFTSIVDVNQALKGEGFELNVSGGEVKGTPEQYLEQSSTLADMQEVSFEDGKKVIPSCFYEFAIRYEQPSGDTFTGFIEGSADKIFDSTNAR